MILFEDDKGELQYLKGDDDSGEDFNAQFRVRLTKGRKLLDDNQADGLRTPSCQ